MADNTGNAQKATCIDQQLLETRVLEKKNLLLRGWGGKIPGTYRDEQHLQDEIREGFLDNPASMCPKYDNCDASGIGCPSDHDYRTCEKFRDEFVHLD